MKNTDLTSGLVFWHDANPVTIDGHIDKYEAVVEPKRIEIKYRLPPKLPGHSQKRDYSASYEYYATIYCPSCGSQGIWIGGSNDYYEGDDHVCVKCSAVFTMPSGINDEIPQVIAELIKETP